MARENGKLGAELKRAASTIVALAEERDALRASHTKQDANPASVGAGTHHTGMLPAPLLDRLRALAPWGLLVLAVVVVVGLLTWPR